MSSHHPFKRLAVFCGSSLGGNPDYQQAAKQLANAFVEHNITCIYGGASVGLMGILADTMLAKQGQVIGVIPKHLKDVEIAHLQLSELIEVADMHTRKRTIYDMADGFILLPGGFGSVEEFVEITTWTQLGYSQKPLGIFNVNGFYDKLIQFFIHATSEQFIRQRHFDMLCHNHDVNTLLQQMAASNIKQTPKWILENDMN